ncbi:proline dehydrogenase family protein [Demequina oxidasica]|uniref:proline dehydrogenase family protein n=1 Tax=Demequina oxidasica TaxID=676199 RepID=UPI000A046886|nr:proline dehydrogenase family protein [Demequina oxidasica]
MTTSHMKSAGFNVVPGSPNDQAAADAAVAQVHTWLDAVHSERQRPAARIMTQALSSPGGLRYLTEVVDGVVRPEDLRVAARELVRASKNAELHLPGGMAFLTKMGGVAARVAPVLTVRIARRFIRALVGHLVVDATPAKLSGNLRKLRAGGAHLNVNLLGEAVLGKKEALKRVAATRDLIRNPDVDYVSIKVSAAIAPHSPWAAEEAVEPIIATLTPLYEAALENNSTFVNLDMEEYRDLDLTVSVFEKLMMTERFMDLRAGIVIQAYLPESSTALERIQHLADSRVAAGGAPLRVRIVKGANLSMERVESEVRDWPLATWGTKQESDAQYKRLLDRALTPQRTRALKVGIAGHNLFDIALAWSRAQERGVMDDVQFEMLLGMGEHVATAVSADVGTLRLYTPVVNPRDFDVALAYLVRRLEEVANPQNFLSRLATMSTSKEHFDREEQAFRTSFTESLKPQIVETRRDVDSQATTGAGFVNTPDQDPARASVRDSGRAILLAARTSHAGEASLTVAHLEEPEPLDRVISAAHAAGVRWGGVPASERADLLESIANQLELHRHDLMEVMASEAGKTLDQSDPEVSEAIDFARYYAARARELDSMAGVTAAPRPLTLVTPPWNFPVAIPAGSVLASLAAGSAVILKPARESRRCGAVLAEAMWAAGVPKDLLTLMTINTRKIGDNLLTDKRIDQVILTGGFETAELFLSKRPDMRLHAETSGKNVLIVTPSADLDLAAKDLVASAFGHAGQKCSASSVAILVGSVADSRRFHDQLLDAVKSLHVARATEITAQMGPVISEPTDKLLRGLTDLDGDEQWWVEPRRLADALWTPGVRGWVEPGSFMHTVECFGPVLGMMRADTLDEAIDLVNRIDYGLTSGIHTLDEAEIRHWMSGIHAGNLYVNRGTTGAIVQRQPFGGWKRSVVGPTVKAGGPHYVQTLTGWTPTDAGEPESASVPTRVAPLVDLAGQAWVRRGAELDAAAWVERFGIGHDPTGLVSERNVLRYLPAPTVIRWDGENAAYLARVASASVAAHVSTEVSVAANVADDVAHALAKVLVPVIVEDASALADRVAAVPGGRVRTIGTVENELRGRPDVAVFDTPVSANAELEMMPFLREQAISMTAHRYGTPFAPAEAIGDELVARRSRETPELHVR